MTRLLLIALLSFLPSLAYAQEEKTEADSMPSVDWVSVESTGTLSSVKDGALEKTLWANQRRSDIEETIKTLPDQHFLRSALSLQRRLLLTRADASVIQNDVGPIRGNDLLIQRINKLMDMGLYDDAWTLYTLKAEEPYDVSIAQMGMLLLVMKDDLATACLEEKVFASKYPSDAFFKQLDTVCNQVMADKPIPGPVVAATDAKALIKMSPLDRALALALGKIKYDGLTRDALAKMPSTLLSFFLMDKTLPETAKVLIKTETDARGMSWYLASVASDESYKKAKAMGKDAESQWPILESALTAKSNPADLHAYIDMLSAAKPTNLSTDTVVKVMGALLSSAKPLPEFWLAEAKKRASEKPIIYIYLKAFKSLTPTPDAVIEDEILSKELAKLKPTDSDQIIAIIESLDKKADILNNLLRIYEKHSSLTSAKDYVMPNAELSETAETASDKKQIGITVMEVSIALAAKPDNMYSGTIGKSLNSLLNTGLIEDANVIGSEIIASVLNKY